MATQTLNTDWCAGVVMDGIPPVMRFIRAEMRRYGARGLSMPQFRTLAFLRHEPGASLSAVAEHLGVTPSTASSIADRLVRQGLIERVAHPEERRRIALTLTAAGSRLLQNAQEATRSHVAGMLEGLSEEQLTAVVNAVALLGEAFQNATLDK